MSEQSVTAAREILASLEDARFLFGSGAADRVVSWARIIDRHTAPPWRPIETAPKDGTAILSFINDSPFKQVVITKWGKASDVPLYGWLWFSGDFEDIDIWIPTHWMPLPEPPK